MAKKDKGDGEAKPGGPKKLIIIGAAVAVLLAGGTGAGVFMMTKGDKASAAEATPTPTLTPGRSPRWTPSASTSPTGTT